ncbi:DNA alkylation repair enzyme OS=Tsukamurella paurometabola (strain ATCC 8368 / DSM / CCUG 35730/ CIP 100753 / JCM 10117 / KCTC 9821 / NBRC 16120 / NCIMB 702349 / NCTC 13040) OX=521096 GN=Tpau_1731 PE=4 SV=1 [Tsukamurella paurometabola]|uniref:DNA alkylation repair enzyme n=1 Tax=Tsukamurella paurometabola (strain ATCC 8368 / DSM 20162 / CCUG 35730 / CIP 100753 / JCM 10117 / KCTC 9821 / NBRC 16120 / NCIMB 702349 / NCTC 13040) TaxID=521096 RepID=D5UM69_TSUPD|nr:DNA alkylation repair protein [Tsukamurella paurometabola]ADG78349.1 DNA alkylation repair enzyme [Tsukamurella paurometabola DSM 20162]SUP31305.1 DNA alkylation repair enzyme [Tsukamurella paurometabola]
MTELADRIRAELRAAADADRAPKMQAYMKSEMPFLGVPAPLARSITGAARRAHPPAGLDELLVTVEDLWDGAEFREERYAAQHLMRDRLTRGVLELLPLHEKIAVTGAWWDHVDEVARHIADLHDEYPAETADAVRRWSLGENLWLRRLAIISQLSRKDRLDTGVLTEVIEPALSEPEFFLRKAIGWALREHAKTDPDWVRAYVCDHEDVLSGLSRREALKNL